RQVLLQRVLRSGAALSPRKPAHSSVSDATFAAALDAQVVGLGGRWLAPKKRCILGPVPETRVGMPSVGLAAVRLGGRLPAPPAGRAARPGLGRRPLGSQWVNGRATALECPPRTGHW